MSERVVRILTESFFPILLPGIRVTIPLTIVTFFLALVLALFVALVRIARVKVLSQIAAVYVWVIRGTPLLVQLFIIFFGLPRLGIVLDAFPAAVIAFSLNYGAYMSETMRAAITSIPEGQIEAGYTVGMNYLQIMWHIVLPQAFRVAFPPLFNSFIGLTKDTSLAANITVAEMFLKAQQIAARTYEPFALYCEVAVIYLMICTVLTRVQAWGEKKLALDTKE